MEKHTLERRRIVVDGSNIATEGRSVPSLSQLDEAIRSFLEEYPGFSASDVTVVVDASFGHRIDPSEVGAFEQAVEHGEMVTPPAGAVGRGDGFILRIAEKSNALVLSNDSFQEFHAERPWLFEPGRLIGGKPVPGVGWIFTPRTPVRGAKSRSVTGRSKRATEPGVEDLKPPVEVTDGPPERGSKAGPRTPTKAAKATKTVKTAKTAKTAKAAKAAKATKTAKTAKTVKTAKTAKTAEAAKAAKTTAKAPGATKTAAKKVTKPAKTTAKADKADKAAKAAKAQKGTTNSTTQSRKAVGGSAQGAHEALNDAMTFLTFVADHPVGSTFEGTVTSFTSHGAHVAVDGMLCHVPLRGLGDPPPNKARQVLSKGETRSFVLVSLDAAHRRAEVALPGIGM
jgi:Zc3h12a-like Ribonuclease NYN domain